MECEDLNKHDPHSIKRFGEIAYTEECPGRDTSARFIDKFEKAWICMSTTSDKCKGRFPKHSGCGFVYTAKLTYTDFRNLCLNLSMTEDEINKIMLD